MTGLFKKEELARSGLTQEQLLIKFREQLQRDFDMCGLGNCLPSITDTSYKRIHSNLSRTLAKIMSDKTALYQQLLYRIDISEKQLTEALQENKGMEHSDILADLVIKRILQKVILKLIYSK